MAASRANFPSLYLYTQAVLVAGWWMMLWLAPATRTPFVMHESWPETTLLSFALPDLALLVGGSAAAAFGLQCQRPWAKPVFWIVAGSVTYATLWCLGATAMTGSGALSTTLMLTMSCGMACCWKCSAGSKCKAAGQSGPR